ncbi:MAG: hypothetical protein ACJAYN_003069 [Bermanella sp.]|jgi:hypothetical protein
MTKRILKKYPNDFKQEPELTQRESKQVISLVLHVLTVSFKYLTFAIHKFQQRKVIGMLASPLIIDSLTFSLQGNVPKS